MATLAADGRIVAGQLPALIPAADKGRPGGVPTLDADGRVPAAQLPAVQDAVPLAEKGQPGGVATLSADGKVPGTQLPAIDSIPLGFVSWWPNRAAIPAGWAPLDGQTISRATYPDMWASVQAGNLPLVPEATWQSDAATRASYTAGDNSTTLRLPDLNGKSSGALGAVMLRGDGALSAGTDGLIQRDAVQRVTGAVALAYGTTQVNGTGAFFSEVGGSGSGASFAYTNNFTWLKFDNAREARTANETRPLNASGCWIVKLFGIVTNPGAVDAAQLASDLAEAQSALQQLKSQVFGVGQTLRPRAMVLRTWYQNTTGRPILVGFHSLGAAVGTIIVAGYLNSVSNTAGSVAYHYETIPGGYAGMRCGFTMQVPPGVWWMVDTVNANVATGSTWEYA